MRVWGWKRATWKQGFELCHAGTAMKYESDHGEPGELRPSKRGDRRLLLAVDTCGPAGSVALGMVDGDVVEVLQQIELEGRNYSATLVGAVRDLLNRAEAHLGDLDAIVVVHGPGSFTGVRVGLSAVKGLAQPTRIPVAAVSRLEVLAWKAGTGTSAIDAHRHEVFLRLHQDGDKERELLAGAVELSSLALDRMRVGVCDDAAAGLLQGACPTIELVRREAPTAADALRLWAETKGGREFVGLELLDGHYLRRSDAEIFGEKELKAR